MVIRSWPRKKLLVASGIWVLLIGVGCIMLVYPPECPVDWYQKGITNCSTGANIGLGMYAMFVLIPYSVVLAIAWIIKYVAFFWNDPKRTTKTK